MESTDQALVAVELARMVFRLEGLKEDKKEAMADWASQIKSCEKEIRRLANLVQNPQPGLFDQGNQRERIQKAQADVPELRLPQ